MIEGVKRMCKQEYGINIKANISGTTFGVYMTLKDLFNVKDGNIQISESAMKNIEAVMISSSRVALSGSRKIDFFLVVITDEAITGMEIIRTFYIKDLRRVRYMDISRDEFGKRIVLDYRMNPQAAIDQAIGEITVDAVKMHEFICKQASQRIASDFRMDEKLVGKFKITESAGKLENGVFVFNVDIAREGLPMSELIHGKDWHKDVLLLCAKEVAHVIWAYEFQNFGKVSIINKFDNKRLEFSGKEINAYRKRRIEFE